MTLWHADQFLANLDQLRTLVITGGKGTGKDVLASELAVHFLDKGYRFFSNQEHVWNDQPFEEEEVTPEQWEALRASFILDRSDHQIKRRVLDYSHANIAKMLFDEEIPPITREVVLKPQDVQEFNDTYYRNSDGRLMHRVPKVKRMVIQLTEGGRYLRAWRYFENMYEMTRKTDNYIFVPSIRMPHEEMCEMVCECAFSFALLGFNGGGIWVWQVGGGNLRKALRGWFIHWPGEVGLYNTMDYSSRPDEIIRWFTREIEGSDVTRDEISRVASNSQDRAQGALEEQAAVARRLQNVAVSMEDHRS